MGLEYVKTWNLLLTSIGLVLYPYCLTSAAIMVENDTVLPETEEPLTASSSACYGTHDQLKPSCRRLSDTVIAIHKVKVGSKPTSLGCPETFREEFNETCCMPEEKDCTFEFSYKDAALTTEWRFHTSCSGYSECKEVFQAVRDQTARGGCGDSINYLTYTNFMFFEYSCIDKSRIYSIPPRDDISTFGSETHLVYLQTAEYPDSLKSRDFVSTCTVDSTNSSISVYTVDIRMYEEDGDCWQTLTLQDETDAIQYDCGYKDGFNITKLNFTTPVLIIFESNTSADLGQLWLGVQGENLRFVCNTTHYRISTETSDPEADNTVPLMTIIGAVIGVLVLVIILIILFCCLKKRLHKGHRKRRPAANQSFRRRGNEKDQQQRPVTSESRIQPLPQSSQEVSSDRTPPRNQKNGMSINNIRAIQEFPSHTQPALSTEWLPSQEKVVTVKRKKKRKGKRNQVWNEVMPQLANADEHLNDDGELDTNLVETLKKKKKKQRKKKRKETQENGSAGHGHLQEKSEIKEEHTSPQEVQNDHIEK